MLIARQHCNAARPHSALGYKPPTAQTVLSWPPGYAAPYPDVGFGVTWRVCQLGADQPRDPEAALCVFGNHRGRVDIDAHDGR